jgi:hypothetical protein
VTCSPSVVMAMFLRAAAWRRAWKPALFSRGRASLAGVWALRFASCFQPPPLTLSSRYCEATTGLPSNCRESRQYCGKHRSEVRKTGNVNKIAVMLLMCCLPTCSLCRKGNGDAHLVASLYVKRNSLMHGADELRKGRFGHQLRSHSCADSSSAVVVCSS